MAVSDWWLLLGYLYVECETLNVEVKPTMAYDGLK